MKVPTETTTRADIRHTCGHVQDLNAEQIRDYEKNPEKFGLDDRVPDAEGKPTQVIHCLGCNQLRALAEFTFVATGDNLDPNADVEEVEEEVEDPISKTKVKQKVKRKKAKK